MSNTKSNFAKLRARYAPDIDVIDAVVPYLSEESICTAIGHMEMNDPAHGAGHVFWVVGNAIEIIDRYSELKEFKGEILVAAFLHDCASHIDRDQHHEIGAILAGELMGESTGLNVDLVKMCIREHRSSFKGVRTHIASEAVASADKGVPNLNKYIESAMLYRLGPLYEKKGDLTLEDFPECFDESMAHILEKFGPGGYAYVRLPFYYGKLHAAELDKVQQALSPESVARTRKVLFAHVSQQADRLINRVVLHSNRS